MGTDGAKTEFPFPEARHGPAAFEASAKDHQELLREPRRHLAAAAERIGDGVYLAEGKKRAKQWEYIVAALQKLKVPQSRIEHLQQQDNPALVAKLVEECWPSRRKNRMATNTAEVDRLRWQKFPVLDDGFVILVDVMGDDQAVVQAAASAMARAPAKSPMIGA